MKIRAKSTEEVERCAMWAGSSDEHIPDLNAAHSDR